MLAKRVQQCPTVIRNKEGSGSSELSEPPAKTRNVDQPERNPEVEDIEIGNVHDGIKPETSDYLVYLK